MESSEKFRVQRVQILFWFTFYLLGLFFKTVRLVFMMSAWHPCFQWPGVYSWQFANVHCQPKSLPWAPAASVSLHLFISILIFSCPIQFSTPFSASLSLPIQLNICLHQYPWTSSSTGQKLRNHLGLFLFSYHYDAQSNWVIYQVVLIL